MSFMAVLIMNIILLIITVILAIADRLLVNYGTCTITVDEEGKNKDDFQVEGGDNLLTYLTDKGIEINSSCGGKGSCGYCKCVVKKGGGMILPTEELFMSRQEKEDGMRLACQVKVKEDMEIFIPDFLTIIRQMVVAKKFDPNKRWLVKIK